MKKQSKAEVAAYEVLAQAAARLRRLLARRKKQAKRTTKGGQANV